MKTHSTVIDSFQIVGFAVSTVAAIALLIARVDPIQSTVVGLLLAVMTQLFDLQLRHSSSEERVLQANALNPRLYRDPALLRQFRQMVEDYFAIQDEWFELFKRRADEALSECHNLLRSMAGGVMEPPPRSQFALAVSGFKFAQTSLKQVTDFAAIKDAVQGVRGWYMKALEEITARGVRMTMVLLLSREELQDLRVQSRTDPMPGGAYIALADELPTELDQNYLIMDDRVVSRMERLADGALGERAISTIPVEVEKMVKRFDQVLRYARKAEDVLADVKAFN